MLVTKGGRGSLEDADNGLQRGGRVVRKMVTISDKGGRGFRQILTITGKGGGGIFSQWFNPIDSSMDIL